MPTIPQTARTALKRLPQRGSYDRKLINDILDEGFVCHVGFNAGGQPFVIPTGYARADDHLLIHGSQASRTLRTLGEGIDVCVAVTLIDGLVLARSAFHHSMNYRSVMIFGRAVPVEDPSEKLEALRVLSEHMVPGRWQEVRGPNARELQLTTVLSLPLEEASAKIRTGPPLDDDEDYDLPIWAGVVPLQIISAPPVPDPHLPPEIPVPNCASDYDRKRAKP